MTPVASILWRRIRHPCIGSMKKDIRTGKKSRASYLREGKNMGKIQIMTGSASDISYVDEREYNISVIPFPITLGDNTYTSRGISTTSSFSAWWRNAMKFPKPRRSRPFNFRKSICGRRRPVSPIWFWCFFYKKSWISTRIEMRKIVMKLIKHEKVNSYMTDPLANLSVIGCFQIA